MSNGVFALLALFTLAAGACAAIQPVVNASLRTSLESAWWAGVVSYLVGLTAMLVIAISTEGLRSPTAIFGRLHGINWSGGLFGAVFVAAGILMVPRLGSATTVAFIVAGQLVASVTMDHFGFLGLARHPISSMRIAGVALLFMGAVLVRR